MSGSNGPTPPERLAFARRLRESRILQGYRTARSFAIRLGIDENRYTRYERAEVEPDLTLLVAICRALGVNPGILLGFDDAEPATAASPTGSFADGATAPFADGADRLGDVAWRLADGVTALHAADGAHAVDGPLAQVAAAMELCRRLIADPFTGIAALAVDPVLKAADQQAAAHIADLARRLAHAASAAMLPSDGTDTTR